MNIRDLHYLITVADCRQFARAAKICNVSQPSLSMQLKKLEDELGVKIFERNGRELIITQVGKLIIQHARAATFEVEEMKKTARQFLGDSAEFRLGIIPTIAPYLLPQYLPKIRKAIPDLKLRLIEAQTEMLENLLRKGELDGIILSDSANAQDFFSATLYNEPCYVAVPKKHFLAKRKFVKNEDLAGERVLLLEEGHCLRNQMLSLCSKDGMQENLDFRATSLETLRHMVASGEGITIMPQLAMKKNDNLIYLKCNEPGFTREVRLASRHTTSQKKIINQLILLAKQLAN